MPDQVRELRALLEQRQEELRANQERFRNVIENNVDGILIVDLAGIVRFVNPAAKALLSLETDELVGQVFGFPLVAGETTELDILRAAAPAVAEMRVTETEWEGAPAYLASLRDVTERKRTAEALAWEAGVNRAIAQLSEALISSASLDEISALVLERAKELTASAFGYVGYIDEQMGFLVCPTMTRDIWDACQVPDKDIVFREFGGLWGWVLENRTSLLTNAPATHPHASGIPQGHLPIRRFLSAPALVSEALVGQIALANPGRDYVRRDLELVERLASLYALAVQRKRGEKQLRFQAQLLGDVRESIVATDLEGRVVYWGKGAEVLYGYQAEEMMGQSIARIDALPEQEAERRRRRHVLEHGVWSGQHLKRRKDGSLIWADTVISLATDDKDQPFGMISIDRDVTERMRAEEALRESESRYSSLFENNHAAMLLIDPDTGDIVDANPAACDFYGYSREALMHKKVTDINTYTREQVFEEMERAKSARRQHFFFRHRLASGELRDVEVYSGPIQVRGKKLLYSIVHDITERKQAEEALRQRHRELGLLNRVGQELSATLDRRQISERLLAAVTEVIAVESVSVWLWDGETVDRLTCWASFRRESQDSVLDNGRLRARQGIVNQVAQTGKSVILPSESSEYPFSGDLAKATARLCGLLLATPLLVREKVIGVLEVVDKGDGDFDPDDVALIQTLSASAAVALDNARLMEELRQHAAELEARNQELDAFAHTVAHDLKSPLATMVGYCDVLGEYSEDSNTTLQTGLKTVAQYGRKMSSIVDELLLLSSVREIKEVHSGPLDMAAVVAEAQERLSYMIKEYEGEVIVPDAWPVALGYAPWVEEVWVNYLTNALKYGGRPPRVTLGAERQANGLVRFWVRDNGGGLTPQEQERLFIPFERLGRLSEGHGLGLSIVRRIVEKLGGQVEVESQKGQGSVFSFTLPAASSAE